MMSLSFLCGHRNDVVVWTGRVNHSDESGDKKLMTVGVITLHTYDNMCITKLKIITKHKTCGSTLQYLDNLILL